jgi:hypothetical protein
MRAWWYDTSKAVVKNDAGRELTRLTLDENNKWIDDLGNSFATLNEAEIYYVEYEKAVALALAGLKKKA